MSGSFRSVWGAAREWNCSVPRAQGALSRFARALSANRMAAFLARIVCARGFILAPWRSRGNGFFFFFRASRKACLRCFGISGWRPSLSQSGSSSSSASMPRSDARSSHV